MRMLVANVPFVKFDASGQIHTGPNAGSRWPFTIAGDVGYAPYPFFMGYAVSYLRHHGVEAGFYDGVALRRWNYQRVCEDIAAQKPEILVLETSTPLFKTIDGIAHWAKSQLGCRVVLVGPHMAVYGDDCLTKPYIDHVVVGEYERPLLDIGRRGERAERKYTYLHVEDINQLDGRNWLPYRPLPYLRNYWDPSMATPRPQLTINTSRGCPFKCTYCQWPKVMNNGQYRNRAAEFVIDEIQTTVRQYDEYLQKRHHYRQIQTEAQKWQNGGQPAVAQALRRHAIGIAPEEHQHPPTAGDLQRIGSIFFDDDTWNLGVSRIKKLCQGLKQIGLPWTMMGRIDTSSLDIYDLMVDSGCVGMRFGVESFNQRLLDNTKKHLDAAKSYENIKYLVSRFQNLEFHFTTMINLPGQSQDDWDHDKRTLNELRELGAKSNNRIHWQTSDCIAFPGTELWEEMVDSGRAELLRDFDMFDGNPESSSKLAQAVGWLGEDYKPKWSKYSKMGNPELLPEDTRQAMDKPSRSTQLPVVR